MVETEERTLEEVEGIWPEKTKEQARELEDGGRVKGSYLPWSCCTCRDFGILREGSGGMSREDRELVFFLYFFLGNRGSAIER